MSAPPWTSLHFTIEPEHMGGGFRVRIRIANHPRPDRIIRGAITKLEGDALVAAMRRMTAKMDERAKQHRNT